MRWYSADNVDSGKGQKIRRGGDEHNYLKHKGLEAAANDVYRSIEMAGFRGLRWILEKGRLFWKGHSTFYLPAQTAFVGRGENDGMIQIRTGSERVRTAVDCGWWCTRVLVHRALPWAGRKSGPSAGKASSKSLEMRVALRKIRNATSNKILMEFALTRGRNRVILWLTKRAKEIGIVCQRVLATGQAWQLDKPGNWTRMSGETPRRAIHWTKSEAYL